MSEKPPSHGELKDLGVNYSFYTRQEGKRTHYVVNYRTSEWWIQIGVVFADKWKWLRHVHFDSQPVFNQERKGVLWPRKVVAAILRGTNRACHKTGLKLRPRFVTFSNADFKCYEFYEHAAAHLVNHIAADGQFASLQFISPLDMTPK